MDEMNMILDKHLGTIAVRTSLIEEQMEVKTQLEIRPSREMIAAMCLQGVLSAKDYGNPTSAAQFAILCADVLLHELERTEE